MLIFRSKRRYDMTPLSLIKPLKDDRGSFNFFQAMRILTNCVCC